MKAANLEKLSPLIEQFMRDRDWDQFHSLKNLSMALSVEISELVEIFQWMTEEGSNKCITDPKIKNKVQAELADIAVYLIRILQKTDINLEDAIIQKMKLNGEKYPIETSKGSAKKYDE